MNVKNTKKVLNKTIDNYIYLIGKLNEYLINNADVAAKLPTNSSFIIYSLKSRNYFKYNEKRIEQLLKEGKKVVKAEQTKSSIQPWKLTILN